MQYTVYNYDGKAFQKNNKCIALLYNTLTAISYRENTHRVPLYDTKQVKIQSCHNPASYFDLTADAGCLSFSRDVYPALLRVVYSQYRDEFVPTLLILPVCRIRFLLMCLSKIIRMSDVYINIISICKRI